MEQADLNLACAWALVDELVAGGVEHACLSPGSRSTPLAVALARHPDVTLHVHLDERSSAFFAVGLARASRRPVAIACTSGTAAAEFLPAVIEASQSRVPIAVLTADRPPRLRGTGANQTIDQPGLYGLYVRGSIEMPLPETEGQDAWWRQAAREALDPLLGDPPGPVHINCPFEQPLTPSADVGLPAPTDERPELPRRPDAELTAEEGDRLAAEISGARGAVVMGAWPGDLSGEAEFWGGALGWPVVAEPTSTGLRPGDALSAAQMLLGDARWVAAHRPELVVQVGATPTSRASQAFVASSDRVIVADRWHLDPDPERHASWRLAVDADALREVLRTRPIDQAGGVALMGEHTEGAARELWEGRLLPPPPEWREGWRAADAAARSALDAFLDGIKEPFEPRIARDVAAWIPEGGTLFVGNSTPIRDLDLAMAPRDGLRVIGNRGASGIDGLVSTALGIASAGPRHGPVEWTRPQATVTLVGDLSFLYDLGAVAWNARRGIDLIVVVVANGGGEIFSLLPQRELAEHRELFVTPHGADLGALIGATGAGHARVTRTDELVPALDRAHEARGLQVVEIVVDPARALELRSDLRAAVSAALPR
ncbi:MAG: 2-succinyl-5-enolpyruvyl-6-hydroxy-3-cyclohexene-1-carboxylic-acid synthase [Actinomycetota bacterium]